MLKRNVTAAVLIAVGLFFILYLRTIFVELTDILFFAFTAVGAVEMCLVGKQAGYRAMILPIALYLAAFYPLFYFFGGTGVLAAAMISVVAALAVFILRRQVFSITDLEYTLLVLFYPLLLCSSFFLVNHSAGNLLGIFYILFVTFLSDAFALFAGILFGKKKLIEDVSPKKTVAGAVGAYVGGVLGATAVFLLFDVFRLFDGVNNAGLLALTDKLWLSYIIYFFLALFSTTLAIIGDLAASWLKRKMNVKDFGKIFPGHGGVMDRLDSLLFVAPFVCLFFMIYNGVVGV